MKKTIISLIAIVAMAVLISGAAAGCVSVNFAGLGTVTGKGNQETYEYEAGEITEIKMMLYCDIGYYSAPSDTVTLKIQPNLKEYVEVAESNGILTVRSTKNLTWTGNAPVLTVSSPALRSVTLEGAGEFTAHDAITTETFSFDLGGAGTGTAELDVKDLKINMSGAGTMELTGTADTASLKLSGAGSINALELQTRTTDIVMAGVGSVKISCSDTLRIDAAGLGTVDYRGNPSVDLSKGGMVTVNKIS